MNKNLLDFFAEEKKVTKFVEIICSAKKSYKFLQKLFAQQKKVTKFVQFFARFKENFYKIIIYE